MSKGNDTKVSGRRAKKLQEKYDKLSTTLARNKKQHIHDLNVETRKELAEAIAAPGGGQEPAVSKVFEKISAPDIEQGQDGDTAEVGNWKVSAHNMKRRLAVRKRKAQARWKRLSGGSGGLSVKMP